MSNFSLSQKYDEETVTYQPVVDEGFGLFDFANSLSNNIPEFTLVGWKYQEEDLADNNDDPFALTFDQFLNLHLDQAVKMQKKAYDLCKDVLFDAWKKGFRQVVICDKKIIYRNTSNEDISTEIVEQLAKQHNKACYVFSSPDMVEECCV